MDVILATLFLTIIVLIFSIPALAEEPVTIPISNVPTIDDVPTVTNVNLHSISDGIYAEVFMVTRIDSEIIDGIQKDILYLTCANGNVFTYYPEDGAEDWLIGDLAGAIMGDNSTSVVYDDYILSLAYMGYPGAEAWAYVSDCPY